VKTLKWWQQRFEMNVSEDFWLRGKRIIWKVNWVNYRRKLTSHIYGSSSYRTVNTVTLSFSWDFQEALWMRGT